MTRALLESSLAPYNSRVVHTLLKQDPPKGWAESSLLCRHRTLIFDANHTATVGKFTVRLDPELGVIILNEN